MKSKIIKDSRGKLQPLELKELPFIPVRVFYVYDVPIGTLRGEHAHYKTKQVLLCLSGEISLFVHDGRNYCIKPLREGESFFLDKMMWSSQRFIFSNTVLAVFCSTEYDIDDYITDFNKFKCLAQKQNNNFY